MINIKAKELPQKIIFTDCFNTLLGRVCSPNDMIFKWCEAMNEIYPQISPEFFFRLFFRCRIERERIDSLEIENAILLTDIREIFGDMYVSLVKYNFLENVIKSDFIKTAFDLYFHTECSTHFIKKRTLNFLKNKRSQGCKIYLISDFYCGDDVLKQWLTRLGVEVNILFDGFFVSVDYKKAKSTGSLYREALQELKIEPKNVLMIGDYYWSDIYMARQVGLHTKRVLPPREKDCHKVRQMLHRLQIPKQYQEIFAEKAECPRANFAFLLYLFIKRLATTCEHKGVKRVLFMQNDGVFLQKLFEHYAIAHDLKIDTQILHKFQEIECDVEGNSCVLLREEAKNPPLCDTANCAIRADFESKNAKKSQKIDENSIFLWGGKFNAQINREIQSRIKNYANVWGGFIWSDSTNPPQTKMYGLIYSCNQAKSQIFNAIWGVGRDEFRNILQSNCVENANLQNLIAQKFDEIMRVDDEFYSEIDSICAYMHVKMIQVLLKSNNNFLSKTNKNCRKLLNLGQKDKKLLSQKLKIFKKSRLFWP